MKCSGPIFLLFELFCSICTTYTYIFTSLGKFYNIFSCCVLPLSEAYSEPLTTEQTFVGLQDVFKTSSRHVLKTSSTWLQRNNFLSFKMSWRRLEDSLKMSCKTKNCYTEDVFKTSWRRFQDVLETNKLFTGDICI